MTFDSAKEAKRYQELKLLLSAGVIENLRLQPVFRLAAPTQWADGRFAGYTLIGHYVADFEYVKSDSGEVVTEDVKGFLTPIYRWKKKHAEAQYGMHIQEL